MSAEKPNPHDPQDRFCYFSECLKQYASLGHFKRHVLKVHGPGIAYNLHLIDYEEWAGRRLDD